MRAERDTHEKKERQGTDAQKDGEHHVTSGAVCFRARRAAQKEQAQGSVLAPLKVDFHAKLHEGQRRCNISGCP